MRILDRLRNLYSGWWVLFGVTLLGVMSGGILYHGAAVFFNPIRRDLNLSSANTSLIFTLSRAQSSLAAPLYGWLVDRLGPRPLIVIGTIVASVGLVDHNPHRQLHTLPSGLRAAGIRAFPIRIRPHAHGRRQRLVRPKKSHRHDHTAHRHSRRRRDIPLPARPGRQPP